MIFRFFCALSILFSYTMHGAIILKGNESADNETFSFQIEQNRVSNTPDLKGLNLYVAAKPASGGTDNVNEFGVSRVTRDTTQFVGLTPQQVKFNGSKEKIANPLYDNGIAFMALFNGEGSILSGAIERPVVVTDGDRQTIYFINNFNADGKRVDLLSAHNLTVATNNVPDATGAITAGMVGIESASPYVFAAVRPTAGAFGAVGSGVALTAVGVVSATAGKFTAPVILDAPTGSSARPGGNRALPLDITSDAIKIGANLASIGSIIDMHWHSDIGRLYIALQITGGAAGTDGGRAIVIGRVTDNKLVFDSIAPTGAFSGALNKTVGAVGSSAAVSMHKVRGMFSSTSLPYLIVQGNVGAPGATRRAVFAVPLVSGNSDVTLNGTIANKNATPEDVFTDTTIPLFSTRIITEPATTPAQMPLSSDAAAQVGAGMLPDGDIVDLFVYADTVFVTVQTSDANEKPGVFYSQALFETNGKIKGWTTWRRAIGTDNKVQSALLDPVTGQFSSLVANNANEVKTVKRTQWADGDANGLKPVADTMADFLVPLQGGIQGLFDFVVTATNSNSATPGLRNISALVATGLDNVMLVQTSAVIAGGIIPVTGSSFGPVAQFTAGEITQTFPINDSKIITIRGGILDEIGPINAAEIARDGGAGSNGYLFVGGVDGLAVLSKADGSGWSTATGLGNCFVGLTSGMSFKKVGSYKNVRKLINDDRYLYILTPDKLDRIDLTQGNVGLGTINATTVAERQTVPGIGQEGSFLDAIISQQLLLLATSHGLLRIGNGLDVRTIDSNGISWKLIAAPETIGPIAQLFTLTQTGRSQDIARTANGGNILALSAFRGKNQAQMVRYEVRSVAATGVIDTTVQRITDLFVENIPSYFVNFGQFRNSIATDGSLYFSLLNKQLDIDPMITVLNASRGVQFGTGVQTGSRFLNNKVIPIDVEASDLIVPMIQNSATGSWLVGSNAGLGVNE